MFTQATTCCCLQLYGSAFTSFQAAAYFIQVIRKPSASNIFNRDPIPGDISKTSIISLRRHLSHNSFFQPILNIIKNSIYVLIILSPQQGVPHAIIKLEGFVCTFRSLKESFTNCRISNHITPTMHNNKREADLMKPLTEISCYPHHFMRCAKPRFSIKSIRISQRELELGRVLEREQSQLLCGDYAPFGCKPTEKCKEMGEGPRRFDAIGDLTHGREKDGAIKSLRVRQVDKDADSATKGLPKKKERKVFVPVILFLLVEESKEILCDKVEVGYKGLEAFRVAMAFNVHSENHIAHGSEADCCVLKGPADVVCVAMDHADAGQWGRVRRLEGASEKTQAPRRDEDGRGTKYSMLPVVLLLITAPRVCHRAWHLQLFL
eukprot:c21462_g1_i1 orf=156-1289(-)